jgi:hypothetical protein
MNSCVTPATDTKYRESNKIQSINNEKIVQLPTSQVWDILVKEISKSFYVINNIDKESRIINVSFSSTSPSNYIDCGKTTRTFKKGEQEEVTTYENASSATYNFADPTRTAPAFYLYYKVYRRTKLEGRANIYVAPYQNDSSKTIITVNARYILNVSLKSDYIMEHFSGEIQVIRGPEDEEQCMFDTKTSSCFEINKDVCCSSKGLFEKTILDMVK